MSFRSFVSSASCIRSAASRARSLTSASCSQLLHPTKCSAQQRSFVATPRRRNSETSRPEGHGETSGGTHNDSSSQSKTKKEKSQHALFYSNTLPAMIPVVLLGSAVYLGLKLLQQQLAAEKALDEANAKIAVLELRVEELIQLRDERTRAAEQKLPPVIDQQKTSRWWFAQA